MKLTVLLFLCFGIGVAHAQLFTEVSADLGVFYSNQAGNYGGGVSFFDANHDGWDDITFCRNGNGVFFYENAFGSFLPPINIAPYPGIGKHAVWIDYDNDGDSDLFVTRYFGKWSLYRNNGSVLDLEDVTLESGLYIEDFPQGGGTCWADINNDGFLDVYISNYNFNQNLSTNFMYLNNGDGTFTDVTELSGTGNGWKASFQGLFFDYDQNGTQDLFVINDRIPYSNSFYKNEGGTFEDLTLEVGLEQYIFSMNASISDIDHDGEYELYISNNPSGNSLFSYNPELVEFENISSESGTQVFDHSWSANWIDADNDTWEDLHVAVSPFWGQPGQDRFFFNNGDGTFSMDLVSSGFNGDASSSHSSAIGDFNNDGFSDLVVVNDAPSMSHIYRNNGNENNYLKVNIEGVNCNRDAFGARIEVYLGNELLVKTKHGGECYLSQNSQYEIFGLGQAEIIDSLSIIWPGGFKETTYEIPANTYVSYLEGEISEAKLQVLGEVSYTFLNLCTTDSIALVASNNDPVLWSTGVIADSIWVYSPGDYFFSYEDGDQTTHSDTITVVGHVDFNIVYAVNHPLCFGQSTGSISFEVTSDEPISSYTVNGDIDPDLTSLTAGSYELTINSENGCESFETIHIIEPDELTVDFIVNQAQCYSEISSVSIEISGGTEPINVIWEGFDPENALPGDFTPFVQDLNGCLAFDSISILEVTPMLLSIESIPSTNGTNGSIECQVQGGAGNYTFNWSGPENYFSLNQNIYNLAPGTYSLIVFDENECFVTHTESISAMNVDETKNRLVLFPNPASNHVVISHAQEIKHVEVYNVNGKLLYSEYQRYPQNHIRIDVDQFARGFVFLRIETETNSFYQAVLLQ